MTDIDPDISWTTSCSSPPDFGDIPNAIIEHLRSRHHLSVYWMDGYNIEARVVMDVSLPHAIFPEYPGRSIGRITFRPDTVEWEASELYDYAAPDHRKLRLDASDPTSFDLLDDFLRSLAGK